MEIVIDGDAAAPAVEDGTIDHPQVVRLELSYEKLPIPDTDRQTLAVYHAEPGSESAQKLALLASMVAEDRRDTLERVHR